MKLRVQRLTETAALPQRSSNNAAGYDLFASEAVTIPASQTCEKGKIAIGNAVVSTGLIFEIPIGYYGRIVERSGLAFRHQLKTGAGVIDADYRGEVRVLVYNLSSQPFTIEQGQRFAQIIFEKIGEFEIIESDELSETERGGGGFGSTGLR